MIEKAGQWKAFNRRLRVKSLANERLDAQFLDSPLLIHD